MSVDPNITKTQALDDEPRLLDKSDSEHEWVDQDVQENGKQTKKQKITYKENDILKEVHLDSDILCKDDGSICIGESVFDRKSDY